ncbi:MAG: TrmH family RNA methyltransferase [Gammaproteobacteria bacterium]
MTETALSSRDNPIFRRLKKLAESARARREAAMTLLDGEHLLAAYLDAGGAPHTLVRAASCDAGRLAAFAARCPQAKCVVLPDALFAELSPVATPTGLLAEAAWLVLRAAADAVPFVVVLEDIQDPGNLGAMLRTAAAAGATLAVLSKGCHDPWSPKALRGGQGAQFVLPLRMGEDLVAWLRAFDGERVALALGQDCDFYGLDLRGPLAIVVGNEGAGLSPAACAASTRCAQIPMAGRVESLNASAALAVAAFEAARQRR